MTTRNEELTADALERTVEAFHAPQLQSAARERMLEQALQQQEASTPGEFERPANTGMRWALVAAAAATLLVASAPLLAPLVDSTDAGSAAGAPALQEWAVEERFPHDALDPLDPDPSVGAFRFAYAIRTDGTDEAVALGVGQVLDIDADGISLGLDDAPVAPLDDHRLRLVPYREDTDEVDVAVTVTPVGRRWLAANQEVRVLYSEGPKGFTYTSDSAQVRPHPAAASRAAIERVVLTASPDAALDWIGARQHVLRSASSDGTATMTIPVLPRDQLLEADEAMLYLSTPDQVVEPDDVFGVAFEATGVATISTEDPSLIERMAYAQNTFQVRIVPRPVDGRTRLALDIPSSRTGPHDLMVDHEGSRGRIQRVEVVEAGDISIVSIPMDLAGSVLHGEGMQRPSLEPR